MKVTIAIDTHFHHLISYSLATLIRRVRTSLKDRSFQLNLCADPWRSLTVAKRFSHVTIFFENAGQTVVHNIPYVHRHSGSAVLLRFSVFPSLLVSLDRGLGSFNWTILLWLVPTASSR